jgi:cytochrome c biogenesis protein CcdA
VLALVLLVVSVGLADSVNPSTLAPALLLAAQPRGVVSLARFTAGVFVVSLAGGLVLLLGPGELILGALPHPGQRAKAIAEVVGGVLLLCLAAILWIRRERFARSLSKGQDRIQRGAFALGAGLMAIELPTALPYFATIAAILASPFSLATQLLLLALYNVAFVAPLLALLLARELAGEKAAARIERIGAWLRSRLPVLLAALLALLGLGLVALGIREAV